MARKPRTKSKPTPAIEGGEGGRSSLLLNSRARGDARLVERAVRDGWDISPEMRKAIKARLLSIVKKKTVDIPCGEGVFPSESVADSNAIAASRVAATINAQDQADDHHEDDLKVAQANAMSNAAHAGILKLYGKRAPTEEV